MSFIYCLKVSKKMIDSTEQNDDGPYSFYKKISEICSEFDLTYNIFDGINEKIYPWPGPQSIESKVEESRKIEN